MGCLKYICFKSLFKRIFNQRTQNNNLDDMIFTMKNIDHIDMNRYDSKINLSLLEHDECMICLEELSHEACIKINCCQCIIHQKCFVCWCHTKQNIMCPLCHCSLYSNL